MRAYLILFLSLVPLMSSRAQDFKEVTLETTLTEATVFIEGAQITRTGQINLPSGRTELILSALSSYIDKQSIQVKAEGNFTILSVNHDLNYLSSDDDYDKIEAFRQEIKQLQREIDLNILRLEVLEEKESLLQVNKNISGEASTDLNHLKESVLFYDEQFTKIKTETFEIEARNEELEDRKYRLEQQVASINSTKDKPKGEIMIRLEATTATLGKFTITYQVEHAGWFPKYDLRVSSINDPLALCYKAEIYQKTGINWDNIKLRLSNGSPNESGLAPELTTWYLNYDRNTIYQPFHRGNIQYGVGQVSGRVVDEEGGPIPGVNVILKGSTVGTTTDFDGNYSLAVPNDAELLIFSFIGLNSQEVPITSPNISVKMNEDVQELSEVVVSGYASQKPGLKIRRLSRIKHDQTEANFLTTRVTENQTTFEFEVDEPYSIQSKGSRLTVDLTTYEIDANYEYFASPKLDKDAFLMAYITNWDQYNLLEGEANLYFEDTYVGRSILNAKALTDTLSISMGRDKSIVIGRTKVDDFTRIQTIGSNQMESRGYQILVRNKKNQPIHLNLTDQIPVAAISAISVDVKDLSGAKLEESTGLIKWKMELMPQEQKEVTFAYTVKYPKKEWVNVE